MCDLSRDSLHLQAQLVPAARTRSARARRSAAAFTSDALSWCRALTVDVASLAAVSAVLTWNLLRDGLPLSLDSSSQYWPWYAYLGQSLRGGRIPAWNPSTFGGTPFAADALSGWTYVPAMVLFAVLPAEAAIVSFVFAHFFLAGVATAALARALGLPRSAAWLAGTVYAGSGAFQFESVAAQPFVAVAAWLPVCLLGADRAVLATRAARRWAWWCAAAFGLCQIIAAWPGQGAYYAMLMFGAWTAAHALAVPGRLSQRAVATAAHLGVTLGLGFLFGAAGILPRLEFQSFSSLASGYPAVALVGGWQSGDFARLATPSPWYVGSVTLTLAIVGLAALARPPGNLARAPFVVVAGMWVTVLVLAAPMRSPVNSALAAIVPGFASVHAHIPERVLVVGYLPPALLAGVGFSALRGWLSRAWPLGVLAGAACLDLLFAGRLAVDRQVGADFDSLTRVTDFAVAIRAPSAAASFLLGQPGPFRFFGYDGDARPYTDRFADPLTTALLVNNRALNLGLQDVQGYDAVHLARFDAYLNVLNDGRAQNYHDAQVFEPGLRSPLLDLLNVRYVVRRADSPSVDERVVFQDEVTRIVERPSALARGWLVHEVRSATRDEALQLIASGAVDPRQTALLEQGRPELAADSPADQVGPAPAAGGSADGARLAAAPSGSADAVSLVMERPEAEQWQVASDAAGVLVTSEIVYPAWAAYVDGQRAPLIVADGLLRAVHVPAGQHVVDVRYESVTLTVGILLSLLSGLSAVAVLAVLAMRRGQRG